MKAIMACEKHGGVGYKGSMPWPHDKSDLARFKKLTLNSTIIMGRGTWESTGMPKPLPGRQNIVVSRTDIILPDDVIRLDHLNHKTLAEDFKVNWCIGGAGLFANLFDQFTEIHLSHLQKEYECDRFIDLEKIRDEFTLVHSELCMTHRYEVWERDR